MSLDRKDEYVPNEPKKSVPSKFPRLTGRSLLIIQKYLSNIYNKSEHESRKYDIDMDLASFLISLAYFDLPGRDSFVAEFDTDLYQSISKFVEENKETSGEKIIFDYYNSKGINYMQINDWIQRAVVEGFMTYDKGPFDESISLIPLRYDSDDSDDSDNSDDSESFTDTLFNTRSRRPPTESVFDFLWCCDFFLNMMIARAQNWKLESYNWNQTLFSIIENLPEEIYGSLDLEETVNDPVRYPELYHVNILIFNRLAPGLEQFFEKIIESGHIDINTYTDNLGYYYQTEIMSVVT